MNRRTTPADEPVHVVMGDVVGSREVDDRAALDRRLRAALRAVNETYAADVDAAFAPLKGVDEFGGTLAGPRAAYEVVRAIQAGLHPVVARYVVVAGAVDVNPDATDVRVMDGPAFHRADELLAELGADGGHFVLETGDPRADDLATAAGDLALAVREGWTERQAEVAAAYRQLGSQTAVADRLGVSQQAVSRTLRAARHGRVRRAEARLTRALAADGEGDAPTGVEAETAEDAGE